MDVFLKAAWAFVSSKAGIITLGLVAFLLLGIYARHEHKEVLAWQGKYTALESSYKQAQKDAAASLLAQKAAIEQNSRTLAERTDDANTQAQAAGSTAVAQYIASHRVQPCNTQRPAGRPATAPVPDAPASVAGSGAAAGMVTISPEDLNKLTAAALRAAAVQQWGQYQVDNGLAVAAPPEPQAPVPAGSPPN